MWRLRMSYSFHYKGRIELSRFLGLWAEFQAFFAGARWNLRCLPDASVSVAILLSDTPIVERVAGLDDGHFDSERRYVTGYMPSVMSPRLRRSVKYFWASAAIMITHPRMPMLILG